MIERKKLLILKDDVFIHYLYSDPDDEDKHFFFKVIFHLSCEGLQVVSP